MTLLPGCVLCVHEVEKRYQPCPDTAGQGLPCPWAVRSVPVVYGSRRSRSRMSAGSAQSSHTTLPPSNALLMWTCAAAGRGLGRRGPESSWHPPTGGSTLGGKCPRGGSPFQNQPLTDTATRNQ